jgi:lipid-binding SYLF domain-containing protein
MKIAAGSQGQSDDALIESMKEFNKLHPGANLSVAAHSLGTQLAWNGLKAEKMEGVKDLYLFNPASSPFQDKSSVRDLVDSDYNTRYFLNTSDVVSNYFSQQMTPTEIDSTVSYGPFARNPLSAHGLDQWTSSSVEIY